MTQRRLRLVPDGGAAPSELEDPVNHWDDYGGVHPDWACVEVEHCRACGRLLVEHYELTGRLDRASGRPTYRRLHSCPTWVEGWRASWWARGWALPGYGHDSHDADNPLSARGYR